jgi:hypothetical protein
MGPLADMRAHMHFGKTAVSAIGGVVAELLCLSLVSQRLRKACARSSKISQRVKRGRLCGFHPLTTRSWGAQSPWRMARRSPTRRSSQRRRRRHGRKPSVLSAAHCVLGVITLRARGWPCTTQILTMLRVARCEAQHTIASPPRFSVFVSMARGALRPEKTHLPMTHIDMSMLLNFVGGDLDRAAAKEYRRAPPRGTWTPDTQRFPGESQSTPSSVQIPWPNTQGVYIYHKVSPDPGV